MNRAVVYRMVRLYDNLIDIARKNLGKTVEMDWGSWTPTKRCLDTMISRRIKISSGTTVLTNFENRL
jgi:hypothetical protein